MQSVDEHTGLPGHVFAPLVVGVRDGDEQLPESRQAVPRLGREVGAAEERLADRREENRHRPAAVPGHRHDGVHVERIEIRPFLPVDLDVDEALVHQRRSLLVLERLVRHHMAPVAGRVADREQDRLVLGAGQLARLLAPWVPVHGILGVLEQVGRGLVREPVHPGPSHVHSSTTLPSGSVT